MESFKREKAQMFTTRANENLINKQYNLVIDIDKFL